MDCPGREKCRFVSKTTLKAIAQLFKQKNEQTRKIGQKFWNYSGSFAKILQKTLQRLLKNFASFFAKFQKFLNRVVLFYGKIKSMEKSSGQNWHCYFVALASN